MLGKRLWDYSLTRPSYEHLDSSTVLQNHNNSAFQPSIFRLGWLSFKKGIPLYLDINWHIDSAQRGAWELTAITNRATNNGYNSLPKPELSITQTRNAWIQRDAEHKKTYQNV